MVRRRPVSVGQPTPWRVRTAARRPRAPCSRSISVTWGRPSRRSWGTSSRRLSVRGWRTRSFNAWRPSVVAASKTDPYEVNRAGADREVGASFLLGTTRGTSIHHRSKVPSRCCIQRRRRHRAGRHRRRSGRRRRVACSRPPKRNCSGSRRRRDRTGRGRKPRADVREPEPFDRPRIHRADIDRRSSGTRPRSRACWRRWSRTCSHRRSREARIRGARRRRSLPFRCRCSWSLRRSCNCSRTPRLLRDTRSARESPRCSFLRNSSPRRDSAGARRGERLPPACNFPPRWRYHRLRIARCNHHRSRSRRCNG